MRPRSGHIAEADEFFGRMEGSRVTGQFPKRVQLGPNRVGWVEAEVLDWLELRLANRDTPTGTP